MRTAGGPDVPGKGRQRGESGEHGEDSQEKHKAHGDELAHRRCFEAMGVAYGHKNLPSWNRQGEDNGPQ